MARQVPKVDLLLRHGAIAGRYVGLIAAVLLLALPAAAQANGALIQKEGTAGCFSWNGSLGCETSDQLSGANDAVVSPDGQNVYVVSSDNSHSITIFDRALDGSLTQKAGNPGCIRDALAPGCAEGKALFGANSVAVSPDGKSVYVSAAKDDAVAVFDRAANGTLTEKAGTAGCVSEDGTDGNSPGTCTDGKALLNPFSVEVSADGTSVYVASASSSAVAVFDRAADGSLTQKPGTAGCISESGTGGGCADGTALAGASGVAVSAAGDSVYATSLSGDSVAVFDRAGDGTLTQKAGTAGCISEDGMGGACTDGKGLWGGTRAVALSPDDGNVYVASLNGVAVFDRAADGTLTQKPGISGCVTVDGSSSGTAGACRDGKALSGTFSIVVSADGDSLYGAANGENAVAVFERAADGALTQKGGYDGCVSEDGSADLVEANCVDGKALNGVGGLATSPDARSVYAMSTFVAGAGIFGGTVAVFDRDAIEPVAVGDTASIEEDARATTIDVLANDTDEDGGPIGIDSVTQPANGDVHIMDSGADLTYRPQPNYCNDGPESTTDDFTYTLNGGSSATVAVTVNCVDDAPVAVADTASVEEDEPATTIDVLGNDTDADGGGSPQIDSVTQPGNGEVEITNSGADLTYQPDPDYCNAPPETTTDDFTYTLNGGSSATVAVTVTCVDDDPVAVADTISVEEDEQATIDVLENDTDPDGDPMQIASVTQPSDGEVEITNSGADLTYQPDPDYCNVPPGTSTDDFTYTLNGGSSTTVAATVSCQNDLPTAAPGGPYAVVEGGELDLSGSGSDIESSAPSLSYSWDVNGDSVFADVDGQTPSLSWAQLEALEVSDGPGSRTIELRVGDGTAATTSAGAALTVDNAPPTVQIAGPSTATAGQEAAWTFTAADPSSVDQAAAFSYAIDWDGDGNVDQTVSGDDSEGLSHTYPAPGSPSIKATATDKDGGESAVAVRPIQVSAQPDTPTQPKTPIAPAPESRTCSSAQTPALVMMGTGNADLLSGTNGADFIIGGKGNDRIKGLAGADCLRGGPDRDTIDAGPGKDSILGRGGDDVIQASSPERDVVNCGGGNDRAVVSPNDRVIGCETVRTA